MTITFLKNCVSLSVRGYDGISFLITHASKSIHVTVFVVVLAKCVAHVSFKYLSVVDTNCWVLFVVLDN